MEFKQDIEKLTSEGLLTIRGSTILVELLPDPEFKTAGGLIVATPSDHVKGSMHDNKLLAATVLATGPGYWDEEAQAYIPLEVRPGAVVVMPQFSAQMLSNMPGINRPTKNKLAIAKEDNILMFYATAEQFNKAVECTKS